MTAGSAIYYVGYGAFDGQDGSTTNQITLDGQIYNIPENLDPGRPAQQILFAKTGLDPNTQHTIVVTKTTPSPGSHDLNIDAFIYTVPSEDRGRDQTGVIVGGAIGGAVGGALIVGITFWMLSRRSRANKQRPSDPEGQLDNSDSKADSGRFPQAQSGHSSSPLPFTHSSLSSPTASPVPSSTIEPLSSGPLPTAYSHSTGHMINSPGTSVGPFITSPPFSGLPPSRESWDLP